MPDAIEVAASANLGGWAKTTERAKDVYWRARKQGKTENEALMAALDDALQD